MDESMIIQDSREPIEIKEKLESLGIKVERRQLEVGDYLINDIVIERKTASDFLNSIYSGRLYTQLKHLRESSSRPLLVIVGRIPRIRWIKDKEGRLIPKGLNYKEKAKRRDLFYTNLAISYLSFSIPVIYLRDQSEFISLVFSLYKRSFSEKRSTIPVKIKEKSKTEDYKLLVFCSLPGIGGKLAKRLSREYTLRSFFSLTEDQLREIEGIGDKKARRLYSLFNS